MARCLEKFMVIVDKTQRLHALPAKMCCAKIPISSVFVDGKLETE